VVYYTLARFESVHPRLSLPTTVLILLQLYGPSISDDQLDVLFFACFQCKYHWSVERSLSSTILKILLCVLYRSL
jgi:hypothetical protein